jgi:hypothetical protein
VAIDHIQRVVARRDAKIRAGSRPADGPPGKRRRPLIVLVRSLAMAALAGLGILVVLPAAIAAQAGAL